jgi:hypothetical protein
LSDSVRVRARILAARDARGLRQFSPSQVSRGRRESRVRAAPAVSRAKGSEGSAHEHTGSAEAIRPSRTQWFTAYFVISPAIGLFCHRRRQRLSCRLDASIEASGPHDFAVRLTPRSSSWHQRPPHLTATFVTIATRPSLG